MIPKTNPLIKPNRWAIFATLPKPKILKILLKPIKSHKNIKIYKAFGKSYLLPLSSKSKMKQYPKRP